MTNGHGHMGESWSVPSSGKGKEAEWSGSQEFFMSDRSANEIQSVICHALRVGYWLSAIDHSRCANSGVIRLAIVGTICSI
ncbi:MAG: hypothetical protein WAK31_12830 [Chthoniobacterales bacterium]